jgi:hypothetical protein
MELSTHAKRSGSVLLLLCNVGLVSNAQVLPPPLRDSTTKLRWSSYVQLRYSGIEAEEDLFALRRLKLMVGGNLTPKVQWYAQGLYKDGNRSPTDGRVYFQEAWLRFAYRKQIQFVVGQFKPPFGRERFTPDFEIYTMDRSLVTDALTPDGPYIDSFYRDRGIQVDGELPRRFRYAVGVFDGRGANHQFRGIGPMVVSQLLQQAVRERVLLGRPFTLQLGGAAGFRRGGDLPFRPCCAGQAAEGIEHFRGADQRWGVEFSADWGDLQIRAEAIHAHLSYANGLGSDFTANGWYTQAAKRFVRKWQAVFKYEEFDPDRRVINSKDVRQATLGLNYYLHQNRAKLMAGYVLRHERLHPAANNIFQAQLQYFIH